MHMPNVLRFITAFRARYEVVNEWLNRVRYGIRIRAKQKASYRVLREVVCDPPSIRGI